MTIEKLRIRVNKNDSKNLWWQEENEMNNHYEGIKELMSLSFAAFTLADSEEIFDSIKSIMRYTKPKGDTRKNGIELTRRLFPHMNRINITAEDLFEHVKTSIRMHSYLSEDPFVRCIESSFDDTEGLCAGTIMKELNAYRDSVFAKMKQDGVLANVDQNGFSDESVEKAVKGVATVVAYTTASCTMVCRCMDVLDEFQNRYHLEIYTTPGRLKSLLEDEKKLFWSFEDLLGKTSSYFFNIDVIKNQLFTDYDYKDLLTSLDKVISGSFEPAKEEVEEKKTMRDIISTENVESKKDLIECQDSTLLQGDNCTTEKALSHMIVVAATKGYLNESNFKEFYIVLSKWGIRLEDLYDSEEFRDVLREYFKNAHPSSLEASGDTQFIITLNNGFESIILPTAKRIADSNSMEKCTTTQLNIPVVPDDRIY